MQLHMYQTVTAKYETAIVGAGLSGLGAAIRLKESGNDNFVIFERAPRAGGTWRDNVYPGCGCDVPTLLYSFSFEKNPDWSRKFPQQQEILTYINRCVDNYRLEKYIQFETAIKKMVFLEKNGFWQLTDQRGQTVTARTVILAIGPLSAPVFPKINGKENFKGVNFHTSRWDQHFDPAGKRIAVIGTGASAIQLIPALAGKAGQLHVFQRSAPWIMPKKDHQASAFAKKIRKTFPFLQTLSREINYWSMEMQGKVFFGNPVLPKIAEWVSRYHMNRSIADPKLREKVLPDHKIGCKRILLSNDYYPALQRPNVELVTEPIQHIGEHSITGQAGGKWEVDAIIYATGFEAAEFNQRGIEIIGRQDRSLFQEWKKTGAEAFCGLTVSGYPGLLYMLGPNSGLGHNSAIHIMESQINYILDYLEKLKALPPNGFLDVKAGVQKSYNQNIQQKLAGMVWASSCRSWYKTPTGKNTFLWPGHTFTYRKLTRQVNLDDYDKIKPMIGAEDLIKSLSQRANTYQEATRPSLPLTKES